MQGGHGYGGYGYGGYGYNAGGAYGSTGAYGYDAGAYGSTGAYGYDAGAYGSASAGGSSYYSSIYPPAPAYEEAGRRAHDFPAPPLDGVELKASEACPKNYVIFDQTSTSSWVTYHPSLAHRLSGASAAAAPVYGDAGTKGGDDAGKDANNEGCSPVRHKEDSAEIDALLMSSEEEDDDVVSTGRAPGVSDGGSPDSTCSSSGRPRKKERIKKMMRKLKGILPGGGSQMDTPAVLDEAVWYLKSLNVQANKRGASGS